MQLGHDTKAEADVLKMSIAGENVRDCQILHDDHGCEVHEREVGFVVVFQSQLVGFVELIGGEEHQPIQATFERFEQSIRKLPRAIEGHNSKKGGEGFRKHMVSGDVTHFLAPELAMLADSRRVVRVFGISQRQPSPGVNEDHHGLRSLPSIEP